jgi:hypothetical protein
MKTPPIPTCRFRFPLARINTDAYPRSANAHDSLGEAYLANHQNALAKASYTIRDENQNHH